MACTGKAKGDRSQSRYETTYDEYFRDTYLEGVNLAKQLVKDLGRRKAFEIIERASDRRAIEIAKSISKKTPIRSLEDLAIFWRGYHQSDFCKSTQAVTMVKDTPDEFAYRIEDCIWAKTFRDLKAVDIGCALVCRQDPVLARALNKNLRLKREGMILKGDPYCYFSYTWKD